MLASVGPLQSGPWLGRLSSVLVAGEVVVSAEGAAAVGPLTQVEAVLASSVLAASFGIGHAAERDVFDSSCFVASAS